MPAPAEVALAPARCLQARAAEYPQLRPGIYLNAASYGPLPQRTAAAVDNYNRRRAAARLHAHDFVDLLPRTRAAAAALIGARESEIALCPNTSVGINIGASLARQRHREGDPRRTIVVSEREFPANVYPWLALQRDGFRVRLVPTDPLGRPDQDALLEALLDPDVAALALSAVQFASGWRAPLESFGEACRTRDILFVVDAIQGLGVVPIDVRATHVDVLAAGAQKWLCSPFGSGFAYVRSSLCRRHEPDLPGWLAFAASADFNRLCTYEYDLFEDARRFEVGTLAYPEFIGMAESLELILEIGVPTIWQHVRALQQPLLDWAAQRDDVTITSATDEPHRSGILCLRTPDVAATFDALHEAGVVCVLRENAIRLSPHFYNTADEIVQVVELLDRS